MFYFSDKKFVSVKWRYFKQLTSTIQKNKQSTGRESEMLRLWKRITKNSKIYNKCLYYIIRHRTLSETRLTTKK